MKVDSSSASNIEEFLKLIQSARVRNAGFETPVKRARANGTHKGVNKTQTFKAAGNLSLSPGSRAAGRMRGDKQPRQVLGTQFDAYA